MNLTPGTPVASKYVVQELLGSGGMATVYRVRHVELESDYALKLIRVVGPHASQRLLLEGKAQAGLKHPNIVEVMDTPVVNGMKGLLMEYVAGPTLAELLKGHPPTLHQARSLMVGILRGVRAAHRGGFVHRDLKPSNVLLKIEDGVLVPKVADFGLVRRAGAVGDHTQAGAMLGTCCYMAPEQQSQAENAGVRADIFSLGAIFYELLCGQRAFPQDNQADILIAVRSGDVVPLEVLKPDLSPILLDLVEACLSVSPALRPASCGEILELLDRLPPVRDPWPPALVAELEERYSAGSKESIGLDAASQQGSSHTISFAVPAEPGETSGSGAGPNHTVVPVHDAASPPREPASGSSPLTVTPVYGAAGPAQRARPPEPEPERRAFPLGRLALAGGLGVVVVGIGAALLVGGWFAIDMLSEAPLGSWSCEGPACDVEASFVPWGGTLAAHAAGERSLLALVDEPSGRRAVLWNGEELLDLGGVADDAELLPSDASESWLITGEPSHWVHAGAITTLPGAARGTPIFGAAGAVAVPLADGERAWFGGGEDGSVVDLEPLGGAWSSDGARLATYREVEGGQQQLRVWNRSDGEFLPLPEISAPGIGVLWLDETRVLVRHGAEDGAWRFSILNVGGTVQASTVAELPEGIEYVWNLPEADLLITLEDPIARAVGYDGTERWDEPALVYRETLRTDESSAAIAGLFWYENDSRACWFDGEVFECETEEEGEIIPDGRFARQPLGTCLAYLRSRHHISSNERDAEGLVVAPESFPVLWCGEEEKRLEIEAEVRDLRWTEGGRFLLLRTTESLWLATARGAATRIGETGSEWRIEGDWVLVEGELGGRWWHGEASIPATSSALPFEGGRASGEELLTWSTDAGHSTVFRASGEVLTRWQREDPLESTAQFGGALVMVEAAGLRVLQDR